MADQATDFQYGVPVDAGLLWKTWGNESESAVYHGPSGQTYLLDELSAWVVKLLQVNHMSQQALADRLVQEFELEFEAEQVGTFLKQLLPRLCHLGLVAEFTSCS